MEKRNIVVNKNNPVIRIPSKWMQKLAERKTLVPLFIIFDGDTIIISKETTK